MAKNQVTMIGEIVTELRYSHTICGERFYSVELLVERLSKAVDVLPVLISERLLCAEEDYRCERVIIEGEIRTFHFRQGSKRHMHLHILAKDITFLNRKETEIRTNEIYLEGCLCKDPFYRITPRGREISEMIIMVERGSGRVDYIPCICWGKNARYVRYAEAGEPLKIWGRIQSREFFRRDQNNKKEFITTYEVSVNQLW